MTADDSLPELLGRLRGGNQEAAARLYDRFTDPLVSLARRHLGAVLAAKVEPEDIVQSVYGSFFARHVRGELEFDTWDSLWGLLSVMTRRKCADEADYFLAACRDTRLEVPLPGDGRGDESGTVAAPGPTAEDAATLTELVGRLLDGLDDRDREIAVLHLHGYSQPEIAVRVACGLRTVKRTLARARRRLERLLGDEGTHVPPDGAGPERGTPVARRG